jgi:SAM-dependent methyltransferase
VNESVYQRGQLKLIPREALLRTGPVDQADWNYRPLLGSIQRARFRLALSLLPAPRVERLLEIGYGSGVFLPTLAEHCDELFGVDVHDRDREVANVLSSVGVRARLFGGGGEAVPLPSGSIDCILAISALEFVQDLPAICREVTRLLRRGGSFIVVTPGHSPILDAGLRIVTGRSARQDFGDRRAALIPTLLQHFHVRQRRSFPRLGGDWLRLYHAVRLTPVA